MRRSLALVSLLARTSGAAAATLAIPLFGGIGLAAAILFAGNGLSARDVVLLERTSFGARAALWTGWVVLSIPPARALLGAPSAAWLRSLPVRRASFLVVLAAGLIALQAPWMALFARDRGALDGLGAGLLAAALAAGGSSFRALGWQALVLAVPLAAVAAALPLGPSSAAGLPACLLAANAGFFRGAVHPQGGFKLVRGPAPVALAGALLARIVRGERAPVARALLSAAAAGALGALGAQNNGHIDDRFPWTVLPIATLPLVLGASVLAGPLVRAETALAWLLDTAAVPPATRVTARILASSLAGAAAGLVAAAACALASGAPPSLLVRTTLALIAWGASLGALASFIARRAAHAGKREGGVMVAGFSGLGAASLLAAGILDAPALAVAPLAVLVAAAAEARGEARRR